MAEPTPNEKIVDLQERVVCESVQVDAEAPLRLLAEIEADTNEVCEQLRMQSQMFVEWTNSLNSFEQTTNREAIKAMLCECFRSSLPCFQAIDLGEVLRRKAVEYGIRSDGLCCDFAPMDIAFAIQDIGTTEAERCELISIFCALHGETAYDDCFW
jgi:hypothetical protein